MRAVSNDAPLLHDVMPWSVRPLRIGRGWPMAAEPSCLRARWALFTGTADQDARSALLHPTRARNLHTPVAQLPGHRTPTTALAGETGRCPEPVRVQHGPYDRQWLIPDHRLIDVARAEIWRTADDRQVFALEQAYQARAASVAESGAPEPAVVFCALLPDGRSPAGRPGWIRPLFRQPGGRDPNIAPGLTALLSARLGTEVAAADVLAWIGAAARPGPGGALVPLPRDPALWQEGLALGRRTLWLQTHGARFADPAEGRDAGRLRLPGGSRPYVRSPLPDTPAAGELSYDPDERALLIGDGRISPVSPAAWEVTAGGVRVIEAWFERRTAPGAPGTLEALRPAAWTRATTSELLELISVLTLLAGLRADREGLARRLAVRGETITTAELRTGGVLPVPAARRRPASVLEHHEEGPDGQFALL
ncbi:type ISP restriction/modification enzyme [Streptomyces sp. NPDC003300]|uniref:type ISP restriction/modification enzyme n=1 Tax=unclassified Streptomyces TaxID=2593676 RepID=UPI0033B7243F